MKSRTRKLFRTTLLLLLLLPMTMSAQDAAIKAVFLFKFIDNVSWPDSRKDLKIGIIGNTEVLEEILRVL